MQFFSNSVVAGMIHYQKEGVPELEDAGPTIEFVRRMNRVADAMNSGGPAGATWIDNEKVQVCQQKICSET